MDDEDVGRTGVQAAGELCAKAKKRMRPGHDNLDIFAEFDKLEDTQKTSLATDLWGKISKLRAERLDTFNKDDNSDCKHPFWHDVDNFVRKKAVRKLKYLIDAFGKDSIESWFRDKSKQENLIYIATAVVKMERNDLNPSVLYESISKFQKKDKFCANFKLKNKNGNHSKTPKNLIFVLDQFVTDSEYEKKENWNTIRIPLYIEIVILHALEKDIGKIKWNSRHLIGPEEYLDLNVFQQKNNVTKVVEHFLNKMEEDDIKVPFSDVRGFWLSLQQHKNKFLVHDKLTSSIHISTVRVPRYITTPYHKKMANSVKELLQKQRKVPCEIGDVETVSEWKKFNKKQKRACSEFARSGILLIYGNAGTGKTYTTSFICKNFKFMDICILTPSHVAMNNSVKALLKEKFQASEDTKNVENQNSEDTENNDCNKRSAKKAAKKSAKKKPKLRKLFFEKISVTLMTCQRFEFVSKWSDPSYDLIINEEVSMYSHELLVNQLKTNACILLVGDVKQLEPINQCSYPLMDIMNTKCIPVVELTENRRCEGIALRKFVNSAAQGNYNSKSIQESENKIVETGNVKFNKNNYTLDIEVPMKDDSKWQEELSMWLEKDKMPISTDAKFLSMWLEKDKLPIPTDAKYITLTNEIVFAINKRVQAEIKEKQDQAFFGKYKRSRRFITYKKVKIFNIYEGDRIMFQEHYEIESDDCNDHYIINGLQCYIAEININNDLVKIRYEFKEIQHDCWISVKKLNKIKIQLAYALTVHKFQGSEHPKIIYYDKNTDGCYNNLLYTAITRATDELHIICDKEVGQFESLFNKVFGRKLKRNTIITLLQEQNLDAMEY